MRYKNVLVLLGLLHVTAIGAKPYIPESKTNVLLEVSQQQDGIIAALTRRIQQDKDDLATVNELAAAYIGLARKNADPRYFGYAKALLIPYVSAVSIHKDNIGLLLNWADIQQTLHQFDAATNTLDRIVLLDPKTPRAHLMRASIRQVKGDYRGALTDCTALIGQTSMLVITSCITQIKGNTGALEMSYKTLSQQLFRHQYDDNPEKSWAFSILADMAMRLGKTKAADRYFRQALAFQTEDYFVLAAYADFLLLSGNNKAVIQLLSDYLFVDALLLRYCIANQRPDRPESAVKNDHNRRVIELESRYLAGEKRGNLGHLKDRALFLLKLKFDPVAALQLASLNWQTNKEPVDALVLLECALANSDYEVLASLRAWRNQTNYQHVLWETKLAQANLL